MSLFEGSEQIEERSNTAFDMSKVGQEIGSDELCYAMLVSAKTQFGEKVTVQVLPELLLAESGTFQNRSIQFSDFNFFFNFFVRSNVKICPVFAGDFLTITITIAQA